MTPELGATIQVTPKSNYDGDTARFDFHQEINIRITDFDGEFDTPEIGHRAKSKVEGWLGQLAKDKVNEILTNAQEVRVTIPAGKAGILGDSFAVGTRVAGIVYAYTNFDDDSRYYWINIADYIKKIDMTKNCARIIEKCVEAYDNDDYEYIRLNEVNYFKDKFGHPVKNEYMNQYTWRWAPLYFKEFLDVDCSEMVLITGFEDHEMALGIVK